MRFAFITPIFLLLLACSQTPPQPPIPPVNQLPPPEHWALKAKLGSRTPTDSGSLTLNWQQQGDNYRIRLQGALGQGSVTINGNADYIVIERPGKNPLYSTDAANLIEETFGWSLPVNDFRYWVRGIANPDRLIEAADYDTLGILTRLQQSRWTLNYSRHQTIEQWLLPGRIQAQQQDARLTLIIREWLFP